MKNINQPIIRFIILSFNLISCSLWAFSDADITIENGHVRETIPGTIISSAYMTIDNASLSKVSLIGATSDVSERIEIHEHSMENGMMSMQQVESIEIAPQSTVTLQPSGLHLMIFDLKEPLKDGENISITLKFVTHSDVRITLPVQSIKRNKQQKKQSKQAHSHHH